LGTAKQSRCSQQINFEAVHGEAPGSRNVKNQSGYRTALVELGDRVELTDHVGECTVVDMCDGALSVLLDDGRTVTTHSILKIAAAAS
jgi:hypothetical protein